MQATLHSRKSRWSWSCWVMDTGTSLWWEEDLAPSYFYRLTNRCSHLSARTSNILRLPLLSAGFLWNSQYDETGVPQTHRAAVWSLRPPSGEYVSVELEGVTSIWWDGQCGSVFDKVLCSVWNRHHGWGVCPTGTTWSLHEETAEPAKHPLEIPGSQAAGFSSQLFGELVNQTQTIQTEADSWIYHNRSVLLTSFINSCVTHRCFRRTKSWSMALFVPRTFCWPEMGWVWTKEGLSSSSATQGFLSQSSPERVSKSSCHMVRESRWNLNGYQIVPWKFFFITSTFFYPFQLHSGIWVMLLFSSV